ncbi:MAG: DUF3122 domain-containing protein [Cyanobacteria bacterium SID2]|nr:DUF3122 domain-containing protein [Cyanobacteria bacterium SID2]MBP0006344.1 DUF3122 domain-containing protein [Cyanobacteria bacterium SBC]
MSDLLRAIRSTFRSTFKVLTISIAFLLVISTASISLDTPSAFALVRHQTEAPGQVVYQARHTIKDNLGDAWQVIFYKRIKQDPETQDIVQKTHLRLAGFPDAVEFKHPADLTISTERGDNLTVLDRFAEKSPAPNIGEYDLNAIVDRIPKRGALQLTLPLSDTPRTLPIPYPVILEWQDVLNETGVIAD